MQDKGKNAVHAVQEILWIALVVEIEKNLAIRGSLKIVGLAEVAAQFLVVVDFGVGRQDGAGAAVDQRLGAALHIDNGQPLVQH